MVDWKSALGHLLNPVGGGCSEFSVPAVLVDETSNAATISNGSPNPANTLIFPKDVYDQANQNKPGCVETALAQVTTQMNQYRAPAPQAVQTAAANFCATHAASQKTAEAAYNTALAAYSAWYFSQDSSTPAPAAPNPGSPPNPASSYYLSPQCETDWMSGQAANQWIGIATALGTGCGVQLSAAPDQQIIAPAGSYTESSSSWATSGLPAFQQTQKTNPGTPYVLVGTGKTTAGAAVTTADITTLPFTAALSGYQARQASVHKDYQSSCYQANDSDATHAAYACTTSGITSQGPFTIQNTPAADPKCTHTEVPGGVYWQHSPQNTPMSVPDDNGGECFLVPAGLLQPPNSPQPCSGPDVNLCDGPTDPALNTTLP